MVLQEFIPGFVTSEYIRTIRLVHYDYRSDGPLPGKFYPPRPEHCLSFYARDRETAEYQQSGMKTGNLATVLFGHQTEVTQRFVGSNFLLIQVVFKPGGLFRLTGIPAACLTNQYLDAETVFSREIKNVNDKINACTSFPQMIQVVEAFIAQEAKRKSFDPHPVDIVTSNLFSQARLPRVDELAKSACQSTRHFERHFKQRMGITPKYFLKVMQFENAFRMKNKHPDWDWLSIAIAVGYHDYQHLAKAYRDLTGMTPNQFHEIDLKAPERLFGEADTY